MGIPDDEFHRNLRKQLSSNIEGERERAIKELSAKRSEKSLDLLLYALDLPEFREPLLKFQVIYALGGYSDSHIIDKVKPYANDRDTQLQTVALQTLGLVTRNLGADDSGVIPILIDKLNDENEEVRIAALNSLVRIGQPTVRPLLDNLAMLNLNARRMVMRIFWLLDKQAIEAFDVIVEALSDEDHTIRQHAAKALGLLGDKRAIEFLTKALEDPNRSVTKSAHESLEKLGYFDDRE